MNAAAISTITPVAIQDEKASSASAARGDTGNELDDLGETLKAAVLSGALSEDDAIRIYENLARGLTSKNARKTADQEKTAAGPYASKLDFMMLSAPKPGQMTALFQPDFLPRDLQLLGRELDLDRDQMAIIGILLGDYLESFELASRPLREAQRRYRRASADQWVAAALDRAHIDEVDVALANTKVALRKLEFEVVYKYANGNASPDREKEIQEKLASRKAWARRMIEVTATMEDRLDRLRERVQARLTEMDRATSLVTAADLVSMARELQDERVQLRMQFTESLGLMVLIEQTDTERARLDEVIARVRIEHILHLGRLGGESMNLWAALTETTRAYGSRRGRGVELDVVKKRFDERAPVLGATMDDRSEATIDREIRGLIYLATRDQIGVANGAGGTGGAGRTGESDGRIASARQVSASRPFIEASRREVAASVAVRDELLALLDESSALIAEVYPDTDISLAYRDAALRRGFRTEMRVRWSERALRTALRNDEVDDDSHAALVIIEREVVASFSKLRDDAIAKRIQRDPRRALEWIEASNEIPGPRWKDYSLEDFLGINHEAYLALDERIEDQLKAILTPEQLASLPTRPRTFIKDKG